MRGTHPRRWDRSSAGPLIGIPSATQTFSPPGVTEPTDQRNSEPILQDFFTGPQANAMRLSAKFNPGGR
jgi:hypothetical protein